MKVLETITMYRKNGQEININEVDRDKYIEKGWFDVKPEVKAPVKSEVKASR